MFFHDSDAWLVHFKERARQMREEAEAARMMREHEPRRGFFAVARALAWRLRQLLTPTYSRTVGQTTKAEGSRALAAKSSSKARRSPSERKPPLTRVET